MSKSANTVVETENNAPENEVTSEVSEQQQNILESIPEAFFTEIENAFAEGNIDDAGLLELYSQGKLTDQQIYSIRALSIDELQALVDEDKENETSNDAPNNGQNDPNPDPGEKIAFEISNHYVPLKTLDEARTDAAAIISARIKDDVEFEGSKASKLLFDLADIAVALLDRTEDQIEASKSKKKLMITFATTPQKIINAEGKEETVQMRRCTAHRELWSIIKQDQLLGVPEVIEKKHGQSMVEKQGAVFDPYNDPAIKPIVDRLCQTALLLAYGHVSNVVLGYMPKTKKRPSRAQIFQKEVDDPAKFWRFPCLPENILKPRKHAVQMMPEQYQKSDGSLGTRYVNKAVDLGPNENDFLVWFVPEAVDAYFQHCFAEHKLVYDDTAKGTQDGGGIYPSGMILRSYDPKVGDIKANKRNPKQPALDKLQAMEARVNKLAAENALLVDASKGELNLQNRVKTLQALTALTANPNMELKVPEQCYEVELATVLFTRLRNSKERPSTEVIQRGARLLELLKELYIDHEDGSYDYIGSDNVRVKVVVQNAA